MTEVVAGWPFAVSLAAAATARTIRAGRRRSALNEALHELRRPLQALALAVPGTEVGAMDRVESSVRMAAAALERLEGEINGTPRPAAREVLAARPLAEAAVRRWQPRAALAGATLELRWRAADAAVRGDAGELGQALDNLIVNAVEHGGRRIELRATLGVGWLRLVVLDSGRAHRPTAPRPPRAGVLARRSGRRGHGLRVVRRIATAHGGQFALRSASNGTEALLELPLVSGEVG